MVFHPNREELAWCAGFFDGEGSSSYGWVKYRTGKNWGARRFRLGIGQNDKRVLAKFQQAVGGLGAIYDQKSSPYCYLWFQRFEHAQAVLAMIWPWLGDIKKEQAMQALTKFHAWEGKE